jgi:hypothetical protein
MFRLCALGAKESIAGGVACCCQGGEGIDSLRRRVAGVVVVSLAFCARAWNVPLVARRPGAELMCPDLSLWGLVQVTRRGVWLRPVHPAVA